MKVLYIIRQELQIYPPCLSQIQYLNDFGVEVLVIHGGCDDRVMNMLQSKGIHCIDLDIKRSKKGYLEKLTSMLRYRRKASSVIKQYYCPGDIIWFGTADSAFLLRGKLLCQKRFVMTVLELYDQKHFYRRNIGCIVNDASAVICCETTRAEIMKLWYGMKKRPYVLPNKPYDHPEKLKLNGTIDVTSEMIHKFGKETAIIYQGIFSGDRDVGKLATALNELDQDIVLYLMGNDSKGHSEDIKKIYNRTVYLGFAPAPFHLEVTSHAQIGVALYDDSSMNNLFCAPNKIYEYAGFGIPIIGSDIPGLRNTVGKYSAGVCVDFNNVESIKQAIADIMANYNEYSKNARRMFVSTDNQHTMRTILEELDVI